MLEIAALVAGLIGASASAISAVKDSRDMSSANNSQLSLVPYVSMASISFPLLDTSCFIGLGDCRHNLVVPADLRNRTIHTHNSNHSLDRVSFRHTARLECTSMPTAASLHGPVERGLLVSGILGSEDCKVTIHREAILHLSGFSRDQRSIKAKSYSHIERRPIQSFSTFQFRPVQCLSLKFPLPVPRQARCSASPHTHKQCTNTPRNKWTLHCIVPTTLRTSQSSREMPDKLTTLILDSNLLCVRTRGCALSSTCRATI